MDTAPAPDSPSEEEEPAPTVRESPGKPSEPAPPAVQVDSLFFGEVLDRLGGRRSSFGRYRVKDEIARGGMGSIQRVWDEDLRRFMAMKVVLDGPGEGTGVDTLDERVLGRFIEEAQVTGQLDHPGIVPVHELGLDDQGRLYFTMRLVRGRDLEKIFALVAAGDEEWTQTRALDALLKVCDAMAYAHTKGVIHRDLKPANVMVGRFGEVYVMDWGLARIPGKAEARDVNVTPSPDITLDIRSDRDALIESASDSPLVTRHGDVMGTPAFMSPEQARGDLAAMGPGSDVYSVGAILYHLLSGHAPYAVPGRNLNAVATWGLLQAGAPDPIHEQAPDAPAELWAICEKAMAREPGDRYASMQELGRDLRAYLEGRVVSAYETGAVAEFRKWVRRNRALAATAFTAGLVIVVGLSVASVVLAQKNRRLSDLTVAAETSARLADERATAVLRLADVKRLQQLRDDAELLWPAHPDNVPDLGNWLGQAAELLDRQPVHRAELDRLRADALPSSNAEAGRFDFLHTEVQWQHDTLAELVDDLARLRDPQLGLVADVEQRLAFAESVRERSLEGELAARLWSEARASIADREDCPLYEGLDVSPQLGLVPLGRNAGSGLWEFGHLQTGELPARAPGTGELVLTEGSGLVFVLVPGGTFRIGAQPFEREEPGYDPDALDHEAPPRQVTLAPFFVSKYEMTQGQWARFVGSNPSDYEPGEVFDGRVVTLLNPVEQVSAAECLDALHKLALDLPTEAQWEYAARAGTTSPWSTGTERESLRGAANLADQAGARGGALWVHIRDWPEFDDGYGTHAPVDALAPNPFGLHHVHGNLWEWCRDDFVPGYLGELRDGDGLRIADPQEFLAIRGGSFQHAARHARSASRNPTSPSAQQRVIGLRPVRRLDP